MPVLYRTTSSPNPHIVVVDDTVASEHITIRRHDLGEVLRVESEVRREIIFQVKSVLFIIVIEQLQILRLAMD